MSEYIIRTATPADFPGILKLLIAAFSENHVTHALFDQVMPETIRPTPALLDSWYIALHGSQVVASVQIVPQRFMVAPSIELRIGGIGQVSCLPELRGQGLMTDLLQGAIERMTRDGYHISILGGDRQRYRRFGWEIAGCVRTLHLHSRRINAYPALPPGNTRPLRWIGDHPTVDRIHEAHQKNISRIIRTREETSLVLQRLNVATWVHQVDNAFAYACLKDNSIVEYGGDLLPYEQLLNFLLARRGLSVIIPATEGSGPLEALMLDFAGTYSQQPVDMIRIFSLQALLQAYRPILEHRLASWQGQIILEVNDPAAREKVQLTRDSAGLHITPSAQSTPANLQLDRPTWSPLLFGPFAPTCTTDPRTQAFIRQAFPLPIIWPPLSQI